MKFKKLAHKIAKALATEDEVVAPASCIKSGPLGVLTVEHAPTHSLAVYAGLAPSAEALLITAGDSGNPFRDADSVAIKQMVSRMLPKVSAESATWQEKALSFFGALVDALCYQREASGAIVSPAAVLESMPLPKVEELYLTGLREASRTGAWPYALMGVKAYLETGLPDYSVKTLMDKHPDIEAAQAEMHAPVLGARGGVRPAQSPLTYDQHSYRTSQIDPVLQRLKTSFSGTAHGAQALLYVSMDRRFLVSGQTGSAEAMRKEFDTWTNRFEAFVRPAGTHTGRQVVIKLAKFAGVCSVLFAGLFAYGSYMQTKTSPGLPAVASVGALPQQRPSQGVGRVGGAISEEEMRQKAYDIYSQANGAPAVFDATTNDAVDGALISSIAPVGPEKMELIKTANTLALRSSGNVVYAFSNPNCSACRHLEGELEKVDTNTMPLVIPVAFDEPSMRVGTAIMCSSDPIAAWKTVMKGGEVTTPLCTEGLQKMEANSRLFASLGFNATPTVVAGDGRAMVGSVATETLQKWVTAKAGK